MPYFKFDGLKYVSVTETELLKLVIPPSQLALESKAGDVIFVPTDYMVPAEFESVEEGGKVVKYFLTHTEPIPVVKNNEEVDATSEEHQKVLDIFFNRAEPDKKKVPLLETLQTEEKYSPPTIDKNGFYIAKGTWFYLMRNVLQRKNTLLLGETGAGKTDLVGLVAAAAEMNFSCFDMAISNPYSSLCGRLRASEGTTSFMKARFATTLGEENQLILLDELSRAAPTAANILLPLLDGRKCLFIEENNEIIDLNPTNVIFATANVGAGYSGVYQMDSALMNRFLAIEIPSLGSDTLRGVLRKRTGIMDKMAGRIVGLVMKINNEGFSARISTRQTLELASLVVDGFSLAEAFEFTVLANFDGGDDGLSGERSSVKSIIQTASK